MKIYYTKIESGAINIYSVSSAVFVAYLVETKRIPSYTDENGDKYVLVADIIQFKGAKFVSISGVYNTNNDEYMETLDVKTILTLANSKLNNIRNSDYMYFDNDILSNAIDNGLEIKKDQLHKEWYWETIESEVEEYNLLVTSSNSCLIFNSIGSTELKAFYTNVNGGITIIDNREVTGYSGYEKDKKEVWTNFESLFKELSVHEMRFKAHDIYGAKYLNNASKHSAIEDGSHWGYRTEADEAADIYVYYNKEGKYNIFYDIIKCRECGKYHILSYSEKSWLEENKYVNPTRCRNCRAISKADKKVI